MTITPTNSLVATSSGQAAAAASASQASSSSSLNLDFAQYLKILTAQLQNQDPTNATDPNQFTQELVQLGGVQQQITTNQDLTQLVTAQSSTSLATGVGYIGNYVQATSGSGEFPLQSKAGEFGYSLAASASTAIVNISDSSGNVVAQLAGGTAAGPNFVAWNGLAADGTTQEPDGIYTFSVSASDVNGNPIANNAPVALFQVTSIQSNADGSLQLIAGPLSLSSADVTGVYATATLPVTSFNSPYSPGGSGTSS